MIARILCALLLIAGLFLLAGIRPSEIPRIHLFRRYREKRHRIQDITGKPKGKLAAMVDNVKEMLTAAGMAERIGAYGWAATILAALGFLTGLVLDNLPGAVVLAVGFGLLAPHRDPHTDGGLYPKPS